MSRNAVSGATDGNKNCRRRIRIQRGACRVSCGFTLSSLVLKRLQPMRLSVNFKKCISLLVVAVFAVGVCGCAPEATTPGAKPGGAAAPGKTAAAPAANAPAEQAGSTETVGAESANPGDAAASEPAEGATEEKPKE
jgi:hypothetical protein